LVLFRYSFYINVLMEKERKGVPKKSGNM